MKITAIRLFQLEGAMPFEGEFWEERLIRPIDVYPEHRAEGPQHLPRRADGRYVIRSGFIEVQTDEGVTGLAGPITADQATIIAQQFAPIVMGEDPRATERIWDKIYRSQVHGRGGVAMMALSALDCALWDLKGKWAGAPVYRLLGGPTRTEIPAYASALGFSLEPERVRERARMIVAQGYRATKWFFRHGPYDGPEGVRRNLELARTLRETVGDDVDIMLDAWMSWNVPYTIAMAKRLAEYNPRWIEEPMMADKEREGCALIRRASPVPIATGEHQYTRWGLKGLMDSGSADILQPDIYWAGGISEVMKICAIASTYDLPVIPHGHSVPASVQLIAAQPINTCPLLEYLIKWNEIHQFFFKEPVKPVNGVVRLTEKPGMGVEIDESKVIERRDLA
ncbi:MAG: mandelate racemase/muconate lactonizing protein [Chloroflexi bacterium]|jgi:L-rhamnonate dehydratase|nr:mandelate racemase/muconate lactonizing protein [Chloroflexota bacterium]